MKCNINKNIFGLKGKLENKAHKCHEVYVLGIMYIA